MTVTLHNRRYKIKPSSAVLFGEFLFLLSKNLITPRKYLQYCTGLDKKDLSNVKLPPNYTAKVSFDMQPRKSAKIKGLKPFVVGKKSISKLWQYEAVDYFKKRVESHLLPAYVLAIAMFESEPSYKTLGITADRVLKSRFLDVSYPAFFLLNRFTKRQNILHRRWRVFGLMFTIIQSILTRAFLTMVLGCRKRKFANL